MNILIDIEWEWEGDSNNQIKKVPPVFGSRDMSWRNWFLDNPKNIQKMKKYFESSKNEANHSENVDLMKSEASICNPYLVVKIIEVGNKNQNQ